jgi:hypothetical protein
MPSFRETIDLIRNTTDSVDAASTNRPLSQLQENLLFLRDRLNATVSSTALFIRDAKLDTAVLIGQPVYYNADTQQFEKALADGTNKQNAVGLVYSKASAVMGDILILGYAQLDLTNALDGEDLVAGRYKLSNLTAGVLASADPPINILVAISDGVDSVFVIPQIPDLLGPQGYQGAQGFQGSQGSQGSQGAQGAQGAQGFQGANSFTVETGSVSGSTTDSYVAAYTTGNSANANARVNGSVTVRNTGANPLFFRAVAVTADNTTVTGSDTSVSPSDYGSLAFDATITTGTPPYRQIRIDVKSQIPGSASTYTLYKGSLVYDQ